MAKRSPSPLRNGRLEEAMALLLQNQAMLLGQLGQMQERFARIDERFARIDERFARIESELEAIKSILIRHQQMLEALPEAVRQKIGFRKS